jgi:Flp pilus assembly protein TadG
MIKFDNFPYTKQPILGRKASAAVEFAIIAPTLLLIFVATFQVLLLFRTSQKLNTMTGNVASMVAMQSPPGGQLSSATLADICQGAIYGLNPLPATGLTLDIASVTVTAIKSTVDYWESDHVGSNCSTPSTPVIGGSQACSLAGGVSGATNGGMLPVSGGAVGDNVIIVRATLTYPGLVGLWLKTSPTLTQTTFTRWDHATSSSELELSSAAPTLENCTS